MAQDISDWLARSGTEPDIAFGHARYLYNVPSNAAVWDHLFKTLDPTEPVLVVAPTYEIPVIQASSESLGLEEITILSYEEFLDFVKKERRGAGRGPEVWPKVTEGDRLTMMVAVEPHMPADCALSLTMVVHWAADRPSGLSMRIITVSTLDCHQEMAALLGSQSMPEPRRFFIDIAPGRAPRVKPHTGEESDLVERVKANVATKDGSQIVVLFAADGPSQELAAYLCNQGWPVAEIDRKTPSNVMRMSSTAPEEGMYRVLHVQEPIRCPFPLAGFDHIHVVAKPTATKVVFDAVTGQLTSTLAHLSKEERKEQLAYAVRSQGASSVSAYVDRPTATDFLSAGIEYRRLQVNNEQLGGFIAALAGFEAWGIDALKVAGCFLPGMEDYALMTMMKRLIDQGLLRQTPGTGCLGLQIRGKEADIFKAVLPILDYDHRLAYFVAQRTDNMILQQSKHQLASLLAVGVLRVFHFPPNIPEGLDGWASECWGYTRPLARQGAMWMALGLWKRAARQFYDFRHAEGVKVPYLPLAETPISVSLHRSRQVVSGITRLNSALKKLHIGLIDVPTADETGELDDADCLELQTHLFTAFLGQLVVGMPINGDITWQDLAGDTLVVGLQDWVSWCVSPEEIRKATGQTVVWGIYTGLTREDREVHATDWAWIPGSVVAEYWDRRGTEVSLFSLLRGQTRPLWNVDEVLE